MRTPHYLTLSLVLTICACSGHGTSAAERGEMGHLLRAPGFDGPNSKAAILRIHSTPAGGVTVSQLSPQGFTILDVTSSAPSHRVAYRVAYDERQQRLLLYGGNFGNRGCSQETWTYSKGLWSQLATTNSPGPRESMQLWYDRQGGVIRLLGGDPCGDGPVLHDEWALEGDNWTQVSKGPVQ